MTYRNPAVEAMDFAWWTEELDDDCRLAWFAFEQSLFTQLYDQEEER